ncbi:hypothetical protein [Streptomyces vilmorinianum]|uniref:hypothetical protein n=1 Tax=Streptomyces vilmorinianum TaxID=3051092 RepID=UPI0010FAFAF1|nr:hypothetical protein [Streptomyces vilmorinianum]
MPRDLPALDAAVHTIETTTVPAVGTLQNDVRDIRAKLGNLPAPPGKTVADRLTTIEAQIVALSDNIKLDRQIFLGYAIAGTIVKFDVQAIKIDLTLLKKIDEKNVWLLKKPIDQLQKGFKALTSKGDGSVWRWLKDQIRRQAAAERRSREEQEKREADKKKSHEERLQAHIRDLPRKVAINTRDIDRILAALKGAGASAKAARDDRTGLRANHKGVDAKSPSIGPVAKDVKNLRSSVDELIRSLGSL